MLVGEASRLVRWEPLQMQSAMNNLAPVIVMIVLLGLGSSDAALAAVALCP